MENKNVFSFYKKKNNFYSDSVGCVYVDGDYTIGNNGVSMLVVRDYGLNDSINIENGENSFSYKNALYYSYTFGLINLKSLLSFLKKSKKEDYEKIKINFNTKISCCFNISLLIDNIDNLLHLGEDEFYFTLRDDVSPIIFISKDEKIINCIAPCLIDEKDKVCEYENNKIYLYYDMEYMNDIFFYHYKKKFNHIYDYLSSSKNNNNLLKTCYYFYIPLYESEIKEFDNLIPVLNFFKDTSKNKDEANNLLLLINNIKDLLKYSIEIITQECNLNKGLINFN